jgi:hypothetical protein
VIDIEEAKGVVADVLDGPSRRQGRGKVSTVTDCELATLRFAHDRFNWSPEADTWIFGQLMQSEDW